MLYLAFYAGHKHAYFGLRGDGIDVDDIVRAGPVICKVGLERKLYMMSVSMTCHKADGWYRAACKL
jgi:hypothetical protein